RTTLSEICSASIAANASSASRGLSSARRIGLATVISHASLLGAVRRTSLPYPAYLRPRSVPRGDERSDERWRDRYRFLQTRRLGAVSGTPQTVWEHTACRIPHHCRGRKGRFP